jgi:hypothetical protein
MRDLDDQIRVVDLSTLVLESLSSPEQGSGRKPDVP